MLFPDSQFSLRFAQRRGLDNLIQSDLSIQLELSLGLLEHKAQTFLGYAAIWAEDSPGGIVGG